jgi:hypothetical protein
MIVLQMCPTRVDKTRAGRFPTTGMQQAARCLPGRQDVTSDHRGNARQHAPGRCAFGSRYWVTVQREPVRRAARTGRQRR